ncbi:MAG: DUF5777 family beta-barrel protein [Sediminibacterium sp.]|nr:DUF5777 family beta-barrel protein [Sediminibacterium sp.]MDP3127604.1 DUF5777 family beta-barrel protein [Sediminibacterium sp.]
MRKTLTGGKFYTLSRKTMAKFVMVFPVFIFYFNSVSSQTDTSLLSLLDDKTPAKEWITGAFKSSRIINNQSTELIGRGVLDFRILHRFGFINSGSNNFFGLDQARMRLGFDYGITENLTLGIGRSTYQKEIDGLIKFRVIQQQKGAKEVPVSLVWVSGMVVNTTKVNSLEPAKSLSDRTAYYHELLIGRKCNDKFSLQLTPAWVHRKVITSATVSADNKTDVYAIGLGARYKLSKRVALVIDYNYVVAGINKNEFVNPLAVGIDIETGGHVFQLHFSNTIGMNEKAFLTQTTNKWEDGDINFGFNISRVFNSRKKGPVNH